MSPKFSVYDVYDRNGNQLILISGNCQCNKENENSGSNNNEKPLPININNLPVINRVKNKRKRKSNRHKKDSDNNQKDNNKSGLEASLSYIVTKEDLEKNQNVNLNLNQIQAFYKQQDFNISGPYNTLRFTDRNITLNEKRELLFKPIIYTRHGSCVGWCKDNANPNTNPTICLLVNNYKDIPEIKIIVDELISSKRPESAKSSFSVIVNSNAMDGYKDRFNLVQLQVLMINLLASIAYQATKNNTNNPETKLVIRGLAKVANKHSGDNNKNKKLSKEEQERENEKNKLIEEMTKKVLEHFCNNVNDNSNTLRSSLKFKNEKIRKNILKSVDNIKNNNFKASNCLDLSIKPFIESSAILSTSDPKSNLNKNADKFNTAVTSIGYIDYSKYVEYDADQNNQSEQKNKPSNSSNPLVVVSLNVNMDLDNMKSVNKNYTGPLEDKNNNKDNIQADNKTNQIESNLVVSNEETQNVQLEQEMGSSAMDFD